MNKHAQYLIVKGAGGGGLGDRIRCVLTALGYAKLTDRRIFVDWSDGRLIPEKRNVFYELFEFKKIACEITIPESDCVYPKRWQGRLKESLHTLYSEFDADGWDRQAAIEKFSFNQGRFDYEARILVMWEFDQVEKILAHYPYENEMAFLKDLANEHLQFTDKIKMVAEEFIRHHHLSDHKFVGVHIRATHEFSSQKDSVKFDRYVQQIKKYLKDSDQKALIFLATDNSEIENKLMQLFPAKVVTRNKWFADPGEKIHFNNDCPDPGQSLLDAAIEMQILASADFLIYQYNSSYGMSAHFLSRAGDGGVAPLFPKQSFQQRVKAKLNRIVG